MPRLFQSAEIPLDFLGNRSHLGREMMIFMEVEMADYFDVECYSSQAVASRHIRYRFGRAAARYDTDRAAWNRVNSYLKRLVGRIADAKMRRMLREFELRGIHYDRENEACDTGSQRPRTRGA